VAALAFEGQVALVTGAGRRIGRSIALRLASEGADLVVNYRSSRTEAEQVATEIRAAGRRALVWQADVRGRAEVARMFAEAERTFGRLDILVNNAGMFFPAPFEQLTEEQWDAMLDTNLKSQFLCAQVAAPLLRRSGHGAIVNISSLGGLLAWPKFTHYCVSKAGVIMLTRCLARALAPEVRVNSVAPGTISFPGEPPDEDYIRRAPLRKTGTPEDVAGAVVFLAQSRFITGQVVVVDGGRTITT
jgi:NAD(P)-dependent dehydrogenase (short-subunit alcohol dehydrogenase family)